MRKNRGYGIFLYDLKQGICSNLWKYILGMSPFFLATLVLAERADHVVEATISPTFFDSVIYLFKGIRIYIPTIGSKFEIPVMWMAVQIFIGMIIYNFPRDDFEKYGVQTLTRVHSKMKWWYSKFIWAIASVILYYALGYICMMMICILIGDAAVMPGTVLNLLINEIDTSNVSITNLVFSSFVLPVLTSSAVAVFQVAISFILNPIYSYLLTISYTVISIYYYVPWFMGANSMILRNKGISGEGLATIQIIVIDVLIIVLAGIMGYWYFKNMDAIPKDVT